MKKLIVSLAFTITLPLFQVAVAQETEITATFSDTDITELQGNVCNNSEVDSILSSNLPYETALDDALVTNSTGNYNVLTKYSYDTDNLLSTSAITGANYSSESDEWELDDDGTVKVVDSTTIDTSIVADPADPSAQDAVTNVCL